MKTPPDKPPKISRPALELRGVAVVGAAAPDGQPQAPRTFRMVANTGEPMNICGMGSPCVVDLASVDLSGLPVPALYDHYPDIDFAVGQVRAARVQGSELVAEGVFTVTDGGDPDRNYAAKVVAKADAGYQWQVSVGGDPTSVEEIKAGQSVLVNGRTYPGPVSIARGLVLREISFVVLGADRRTSAVVAGLKGNQMSFEDFVQSMGFSPDKLDETQTANLKRVHSEAYPEEEPEEEASAPAPETKAEDMPEEEEDEEEPTNAAAAPVKLTAAEKKKLRDMEYKRVKDIHKLCASYDHPTYKTADADGAEKAVKLADYAIDHDWDIKTLKAKLLDITRDRGPAPAVIVKQSTNEGRLAALQGALLMRAGFPVDYKFKDKSRAALHALKMPGWLRLGVNDAARDRVMNESFAFAQWSAADICREACRLDGVEVPVDREEMIRAAIGAKSPNLTIRAASSGSSLSYIFSTSVHAQLLASYEQSPDTSMGWVQEAEVANFQTQERTRIDVGGGLKKLPRGKQAEHADYTDSQETYKIARYAKMFEVDEQDLLDDNLNGLASVPGEMGQAAARLRPDMVYAILLDNPTLGATSRQLFNTTDGNLTTAGSALSASTLTTGISIMALFRENSVNLNLQATHLIVPPEIKMLAIELTQSPQILYGADDETIRGNLNALREQNLQVVSEARLSNGVVDPRTGDTESGDTNAWYLACANGHTIEVGYLRGTGRAPKVRSYVLDKGRWGLGWDVSMDIGAAPMDWKSLYKNAGGS